MKFRLLGLMLLNMAAVVAVAQTQPATTTAPAEELVDNPTYQAWAQYKAGATVTLEGKTEVVAEPDTPPVTFMSMNITNTLKDVTPDHVVVEVKMSTTMMGQNTPARARDTKIPAKIAKSKLELSAFSGGRKDDPKVSDVKEGTDTIEVNGKKLECKTKEMNVEMKQNNDTIKGTAKIWSNAEVPGGLVKNVMTTKDPMVSTMTMNVVSYEVKK